MAEPLLAQALQQPLSECSEAELALLMGGLGLLTVEQVEAMGWTREQLLGRLAGVKVTYRERWYAAGATDRKTKRYQDGT